MICDVDLCIKYHTGIGVCDACFFNDAMFWRCNVFQFLTMQFFVRCFSIFNDAMFKKLQNIVQTMHINDVFAKNSKMREKNIYLEIRFFFK